MTPLPDSKLCHVWHLPRLPEVSGETRKQKSNDNNMQGWSVWSSRGPSPHGRKAYDPWLWFYLLPSRQCANVKIANTVVTAYKNRKRELFSISLIWIFLEKPLTSEKGGFVQVKLPLDKNGSLRVRADRGHWFNAAVFLYCYSFPIPILPADQTTNELQSDKGSTLVFCLWNGSGPYRRLGLACFANEIFVIVIRHLLSWCTMSDSQLCDETPAVDILFVVLDNYKMMNWSVRITSLLIKPVLSQTVSLFFYIKKLK